MPVHQPVCSSLCRDDLTLAARIVSGDEDVTREFAQTYTERFEFLARRAGIPRQDCQDVAQNGLLDAFSQMRRGLYRGESKLASWLAQIIHGKIVEYWRQRQPVSALERLEDIVPEDGFVRMLPARASNSETVLIVRQTLLRIPVQHRVILVLKRMEGYTLEQIGRMCDLTLAQVSGKLYTAEQMFRRCLLENAPSAREKASPSLPILVSNDFPRLLLRVAKNQPETKTLARMK